jgi:type I restriction enzyme, S subunit
MNQKWHITTLGEIITLKRGYDLPKRKREQGPYPIVSSSGISGYHSKAMVRGPGVATGRYGTLGEIFYIIQDYWPLNTSLYVQNFKGNNPRFISYFLGTLHFGNQNIAGAVPGVNRNALHKLVVRIPNLNIQEKIAAILSAYDDLLENNNKRIALLEKAAEEIYREWFVRMRFPNWKQVRFVKGFPEEWEEIKLAGAFEFMGGGTPSTKEKRYWEDGTINWFTPSDITSANGSFLFESSNKCTEEGFNNSSARMFPAYSIMMTSRATIGAIGINTTPASTNQGFITCIPNDSFPLTFLYHWLKLNRSYFEMLASGATFAELTKGTFKKIKILKPKRELVDQFEEKVLPMFKRMEFLLQEVSLLKKSRDLLLVRLISGKLPVDSLDVRFPPGMGPGAQKG